MGLGLLEASYSTSLYRLFLFGFDRFVGRRLMRLGKNHDLQTFLSLILCILRHWKKRPEYVGLEVLQDTHVFVNDLFVQFYRFIDNPTPI